MSIDPHALVAHFRTIYRERMRGLPIVNERLDVEATEFEELGAHRLGVLIAPWFMNMILLPGTDQWSDCAQGDKVRILLPSDEYEFVVCRDDTFDNVYLSAVLFRSTADFPDMRTARDVADEIMKRLFAKDGSIEGAKPARRISRRDLLAMRDGS